MAIRNDIQTDFKDLRKFVLNLYSQYPSGYTSAVTDEMQTREINYLKETLRDERFFFVVDMPNFEICHCHGVQQWLGYSEKDFTLSKYWNNVVHPGSKKSLLLFIKNMYSSLSSGAHPLKFMVQRFSSKIVLKHANGDYLQFKKTSSIFQHDTQNRLLAYMDEFTKIGEFREDTSTEPRIYNAFGGRETEKEKEFLEKAMKDFENMGLYALPELETGRILAYYPEKKPAEIAIQLGPNVHPKSAETWKKRFLEKTRKFFNKSKQEMSTAVDAALFLRNEGLL